MKKANISALFLMTVAVAAFVAFDGISLFKNDQTLAISNSPAAKYKAMYPKGEEEEEEERNEKGIKPAMEWLNQVRQDPTTGNVPYTAVYGARQQYKALTKNTLSANKKTFPLNLDWEELGPDNIGGRTRAVVIDKDNPQLMWAGSVSGGLFYSEDGSLSWKIHPFTRQLKHLGISSMVQDKNGDLILSTGEGFSPGNTYSNLGYPPTFSAPGFVGDGLFKVYRDMSQGYDSLPGSIPTPNSATAAFAVTYRVAVSPFDETIIYAATEGGLYVSTNGGQSFALATGVNPNYQNRPCSDVTVNATGTVYAALNSKHGYRSSDGITFQEMAGQNGLPGPASPGTLKTIYTQTQRMQFAVTPEDPNYVYAIYANDAAGLLAIFKSTNQGLNWTQVITGADNGFNPQGGQGTWNIAFGVDRFNKERLILGGQLELWSLDLNGNKDLIAYWQPETPTNPYYVHADMHVVAWHPTNPNIMFIAGDGGLFRTNNAQNQFPTFTPRNKGYNTLQFYGFGAGFDGTVLGGAQDNGTNLNDCDNNSPLSFREVQGGDGGYGEISHINPNAMFAATPSSSVSRSSNGGQSFGGFFDTNIDSDGNGQPGGGGLFNSPFHLWESNEDTSFNVVNTRIRVDKTTGVKTPTTVSETITIPTEKSIFMLPISGGMWFTPDALDFSNTPRWYRISIGGTGSAIGTAADGTTFTGTTGGTVTRIRGLGTKYRVDKFISNITTTPDPVDANIEWIDTVYSYSVVPNFGTAAGWNNVSGGIEVTTMPNMAGSNRYVTAIAVDQNNSSNVVVTFGNYNRTNHVYLSQNAQDPQPGQTTPISNWEQIDNSTLPDMPVYSVVIDYVNSNNIILGTDLGVWATSNGLDGAANVEWYNEAKGDMTSVPVFAVRQDALYDNDCRVLYVATHGRGSFRSTTLMNGNCVTDRCLEITSTNDNGTIVTSEALSKLDIYPNPADDFANVAFVLSENVDVTIQVVDLMGRVVKSNTLTNTTLGENKARIELNDVSAGAYIVAVSFPGKVHTRKIIVR